MCPLRLREHSAFVEFSKKMYEDKHDIKEQQVVFRIASRQKQSSLSFRLCVRTANFNAFCG